MNSEKLLQSLSQDCEAFFNYATEDLQHSDQFIKTIPPLQLNMRADEEGFADIKRLSKMTSHVLVTISDGFLKDIYNTIVNHQDMINAYMAVGKDSFFQQKIMTLPRFLNQFMMLLYFLLFTTRYFIYYVGMSMKTNSLAAMQFIVKRCP